MQVLYGRHHVRVYRFALRLVGNEQVAEDLISEVFLDVWRQAGKFEGRAAVTTWLLAITRFKALSALRRRKDAELGEEAALAIEDPSDDPEVAAQKTYMRIDMETQKMKPGTGYGEAVSPIDGTVWYSSPVAGGPANKLYSIDPKTEKITDYPLPAPGRYPHGIDFSSDGNVWTSLGSGQIGRLNTKTGEWKFWDNPGLKFKGTGAETGTTDFPYYLWVDQFDVSGLGKDTVFVTGSTSDAMFVFDPKKETFSVFRVPYPMPHSPRLRARWQHLRSRASAGMYSRSMPSSAMPERLSNRRAPRSSRP